MSPSCKRALLANAPLRFFLILTRVTEPLCRIEDVFEWILEVDEDALGEDRGRIQIIVEYQMNLPSSSSSLSSARQRQQQQPHRGAGRRGRRHRQGSTLSGKDSESGVYRSVENRITAHVDIQRDNTYAIVPVVKVCSDQCHLVFAKVYK